MLKTSTITKRLGIGIALNICFTVFEFAVGIAIGSLALISDAAHNLTDILSLAISFTAYKIARKKKSTHKTFGYGKITILAALLNASILMALACYIFYEAYERLQAPVNLQGDIVMIIGAMGILANGGVALLLFGSRHDLNIRSAFLNAFFDALASAGALLAGFIVLLTGKTVADPLIAVCIGMLLVISASRIARQAFHILLDGVPPHINVIKIKQTLHSQPYVIEVKELFVWALSSQETALIAHIIADNAADYQSSLTKIKQLLAKEFGITHTTIEIDYQSSLPNKTT